MTQRKDRQKNVGASEKRINCWRFDSSRLFSMVTIELRQISEKTLAVGLSPLPLPRPLLTATGSEFFP